MPKEHGGDPIITGDDRRDPVKFHQQLGDDRVHSLEDLTAVLAPFEEDQGYSRTNMPDADLETYLEYEDNIHWGNPEYICQKGISQITVSLEYSPWLNKSYDTLFQGKVSIDWKSEKPNEETLYKLFREPTEKTVLKPLIDNNDLGWISVPTDPTPPVRLHLETDNMIDNLLLRLGEIDVNDILSRDGFNDVK